MTTLKLAFPPGGMFWILTFSRSDDVFIKFDRLVNFNSFFLLTFMVFTSLSFRLTYQFFVYFPASEAQIHKMHFLTSSMFIIPLLLTSTLSCPSPPLLHAISYPLSYPPSHPFNNNTTHLPPRNLSTILTDISTITTFVATLTTTAKDYSGTLTETFSLASTVKKLKSALAKALLDVGLEEVFEDEEGKRILGMVGELTGGIRELLKVMII